MKRILIQTWAACLLLGLSVAAENKPVALKVIHEDRPVLLEKFFKHYRCPEPYYIEDYLEVADRYGLDFRLLPAISVRETTCGRFEKNNNRFGFHVERYGFTSIPGAILFMGQRIGRDPLYRGLSLTKILNRFNSREEYAEEVKALMRQIDP